MKQILSICLLLFTSYSFAQIPGKKTEDPVTLSNGTVFHVNDTIHVGFGTDPNGDFKFIYQPENAILGIPQTSLSKMYANTRLVIKHFKVLESKKIGTKTWAVVNLGSLNNVVELEAALEVGEIKLPGQQKKQSSSPSGSVVDELIKLKQLLDAGAISQEEYDGQKKKLLSQ